MPCRRSGYDTKNIPIVRHLERNTEKKLETIPTHDSHNGRYKAGDRLSSFDVFEVRWAIDYLPLTHLR